MFVRIVRTLRGVGTFGGGKKKEKGMDFTDPMR